MTSDQSPSWDQLKAEAAQWLADMDCGKASLENFEAWRSADPRRAVAFAQIANVTRTLDRVKPTYKMLRPATRTTSRRNVLFVGGGLGLLALAGSSAALWRSGGRSNVATPIGGQKTISLPEKARMELNTDSRAQWKTGAQGLEVWLQRGELALDLRSSPAVCFLHAAGQIVDISQSLVNARLRGNLLELAVVAGNCTIKRSGAIEVTRVTAMHAVVAGGAQEHVRPMDPAELDFLSGWPQGELMFQGQSLATAVSEYNRYLTRKLIIADPSLNDIRLGGRFTSHDPTAFLAALHAGFGINAVSDGSGTVALTK